MSTPHAVGFEATIYNPTWTLMESAVRESPAPWAEHVGRSLPRPRYTEYLRQAPTPRRALMTPAENS